MDRLVRTIDTSRQSPVLIGVFTLPRARARFQKCMFSREGEFNLCTGDQREESNNPGLKMTERTGIFVLPLFQKAASIVGVKS